MSIDTLLEAARYLEWQAQQQQITREEEQRKEKQLINREAESMRVELVTSLSQPIRANHVTWGNDTHRQQPYHHPAPPPPSLPSTQIPITVIPMVPVVTTTHSAPPINFTAQIATSLNGSPPAKNLSFPPQQQQQQHHHHHHHHPHPSSPHLLCPPHIKVETSPQLKVETSPLIKVEMSPLIKVETCPLIKVESSPLIKIESSPLIKIESSPQMIGAQPSQSQPQIQIQYTTSISTNGSGSQHALVPHQSPPSSQPRSNGVLDDLRGLEGKRRPGGAGTREVHNKLEKNRRAHLKDCFETLKKNVPNVDEKKTSNLSVLRSALRYIQTLKRKEKEYEHEMERLAREKISTQQRLAELKNELSQCMDVMEIDRVLRQTIQPEDDQASTSTASEGEDNFEQDIDDDDPAPLAPPSLSKAPVIHAQQLLTSHLSIQHATLPLGVLTTSSPSAPPQAIAPAPGLPPPQLAHPIQQLQPTVIAHAAISHPSVIQAVNHGLPLNLKHLTHIAPSPGPMSSMSSMSSMPQTIAPGAHQQISAQPIGHITVHPLAHLQSHLPTLYPQGVSVSQPTMVGHITHTFTHHTLPHVHANPQANTNGAQMNSTAVISQGHPSLGKPTAVLAPHPQLVGQAAVLNPVTMVTVPTFPVSTLKLA
ncbi:MAX network transcriptional repressor b isoform X2 [Notothenia coriiceps]|uniref:Max-binding protein MNT n=1 Tax=Notothenia coriiceps TaxID=8208 RepID=A0A6I9P9T9_9TELE|nr:PREDICTED: max-binding protein MNT-like isoform X2 [Notothenia coriiceps]